MPYILIKDDGFSLAENQQLDEQGNSLNLPFVSKPPSNNHKLKANWQEIIAGKTPQELSSPEWMHGEWELDLQKEKETFNAQLESEIEAIESKKANSRAVREAVLALANGLPVPDIVKNKLSEIESLINPVRARYMK